MHTLTRICELLDGTVASEQVFMERIEKFEKLVRVSNAPLPGFWEAETRQMLEELPG